MDAGTEQKIQNRCLLGNKLFLGQTGQGQNQGIQIRVRQFQISGSDRQGVEARRSKTSGVGSGSGTGEATRQKEETDRLVTGWLAQVTTAGLKVLPLRVSQQSEPSRGKKSVLIWQQLGIQVMMIRCEWSQLSSSCDR